jgi:hypothetical protein
MSFCPLFGIFRLWEKYTVLLLMLFIQFEKRITKILGGDLHQIRWKVLDASPLGEGFFVVFDYIIVHTSV